ncbi:MAG TPA: EamA family transporter RarD [Clostridia bacterium]|nr:EamA family transporter RarD [Clostridia bacterium]HPQ47608.1 EamA family transporter RarD [Clostridia bacterium]
MSELKKGTIIMAASYIWWGIMPLYWSLLSNLSGAEITAYRVAFSFLTIFIVLIFTRKLNVYRVIQDKRNLMLIMFGSLMLAINWTVFIIAMSNGNLTEASMGYYINPLASILLGVIFLKERLDKGQAIALAIVTCGVIYYIITIGRIPVVSLTLAVTFALYGLYKKTMKMTSVQSFAVESTVLFPVSLTALAVIGMQDGLAFTQQGAGTDILIVLSGAATMIPLLLFSEGAKRIPLIRVGFLQYIAPTLMLVSNLILGDTFNLNQVVTFIFIWTGLAVYSFSNLRKRSVENAG